MCRANLVSKTPLFTKSSNVSGGHRESGQRGAEVRGSPALLSPSQHPFGGPLHRPPAILSLPPVAVLLFSTKLTMRILEHKSWFRLTLPDLGGPHLPSGQVPGPSVSWWSPQPACLDCLNLGLTRELFRRPPCVLLWPSCPMTPRWGSLGGRPSPRSAGSCTIPSQILGLDPLPPPITPPTWRPHTARTHPRPLNEQKNPHSL